VSLREIMWLSFPVSCNNWKNREQRWESGQI